MLVKWYRDILKDLAPAVINEYEPIVGVKVEELNVRKMGHCWAFAGRCKTTNEFTSITLNSLLVMLKPECIGFVILHEMVHLIQLEHNREFFSLMDKYMPTWKEVEKELRKTENTLFPSKNIQYELFTEEYL